MKDFKIMFFVFDRNKLKVEGTTCWFYAGN